MKTVAILANKGGVGKSTVCMHLAVEAERRGVSVSLLDMDPQASSASWSDIRSKSHDTPSVTSIQPSRLEKAMNLSRDAGAGLCLIDSAPHSSDAAISAAEASDLVLIPCRAGILDLMAISTSAKIVKLTNRLAYVVVNAAPHRAPRLISDAIEGVAVHGLECCPVTIHQRAAYAHSLTLGQVAQEYEPNGKASDEIGAVYDWLAKLLKL